MEAFDISYTYQSSRPTSNDVSSINYRSFVGTIFSRHGDTRVLDFSVSSVDVTTASTLPKFSLVDLFRTFCQSRSVLISCSSRQTAAQRLSYEEGAACVRSGKLSSCSPFAHVVDHSEPAPRNAPPLMDVARTVLTLFFIRFLFPANLPIVEGVGLLESRSVPGVLELRFIQLDDLKTEKTGCGAFVGAWSRPFKVQASWETILVSWYVTNLVCRKPRLIHVQWAVHESEPVGPTSNHLGTGWMMFGHGGELYVLIIYMHLPTSHQVIYLLTFGTHPPTVGTLPDMGEVGGTHQCQSGTQIVR